MMSANLRKISPIALAGLKPHKPTTGQPIVEYVDPRNLFIDPAYQRSIGERGLRQIRKIIETFDWTKFKLPTVCYAKDHSDQTVLFILDGQHSAIAAASHPDVEKIPVAIVEDEMSVASQAEAFIGINTDRLGVTALQLHQAAVVAGDPEAVTVDQVCERAGVKILRTTPGSGRYKPQETVAVAALKALIGRRGAMRGREVLDVLAKTQLAPITALHIKAVELLLTDKEFSGQIAGEDLSVAIDDMVDDIEREAKTFAATHRVPIWKAMASIWFRKCKKRRKSFTVMDLSSTASAERPAGGTLQADNLPPAGDCQTSRRREVSPVHRTIVPHTIATQRNVTSAVCGDPEPGRSALDQRRTSA